MIGIEALAGMKPGAVLYGGARQPRTLFRLHGAGEHWIGEHGERYDDADAAEELGEFEAEMISQPTTPTRKRIAEALFYASRRDDWDVATEDEREEFYDMADSPHVLALFSQTTGEQPSVLIPDWVLNEPATDLDGNVISQPTPRTPNAALVRVEDMAPGTTFTGCIRGDIRRTWFLRERGSIVATDGSFAHLTAIDPSTIRDVTPPPALPEDGR